MLLIPLQRVEWFFPEAILHLIERTNYASPAPHLIYRLKSSSGDQPCTRVGRNSVPWPLLHGHHNSFVEGFLGQLKIAQQTNERGQHSPRFRPIDRIKGIVDLIAVGGTQNVYPFTLSVQGRRSQEQSADDSLAPPGEDGHSSPGICRLTPSGQTTRSEPFPNIIRMT